MAGAHVRPSLSHWSLFNVAWHSSVWLGWGLIAAAAYLAQPQLAKVTASFWVIAALVLLGELRPLKTAGGYHPQGIVTSTAFVFAMLYLWGPWVALLLQAGATVVSQMSKRRPPWVMFFNVGQYSLSLVAAWSVMELAGLPLGVHGGSVDVQLTGGDLWWMVPAWVVWFFVNNVLVSAVSAADLTGGFRQAFFQDFWYYVVTSAAVLALSPLVAFASEVSPWYVPLLLIPLFAVHKTAQISLEEQHKALHDSLTGLPNRKYLLRTLEEALEGPDPEPFGLCLLDLNRFKEVNDTLGHHVGDRLLEMVAVRVRGVLRPHDTVARLGGDEFALYLPGVLTGIDAGEIAQRVLAALQQPFQLGDITLELEGSVGIALAPQNGVDVEQLLRAADVAMYQAKESHTEVEVYDPSRDRHSTDRLGLLATLRQAIDNGELALHYQPKVALFDRGVVGVEALLRWNHPHRGFIPPDEFIPLAETSGLMHRLTAFVIDEALGQVAQWRAEGLEVAVAVNVSARDLHGMELTRTVSEALAKHRVPAYLLKLELTERTLTSEHSRVLDTLEALEALDVDISLDDFGTGYSSMFMLKRLPVTEIKVDRSFVSRLADADDDASIVRSMIELAHALGLHAVAEGVETVEVWDRLRLLGCDTAQGWFIGRAMPPAAATAWLKGHVAGGPVVRLADEVGAG